MDAERREVEGGRRWRMTEPPTPPNALPEPLPGSRPGAGEPARADAVGVPMLTNIEVSTARGYIDAARGASTRTAYGADWRRFSLWCRGRDAPALPAEPALGHGDDLHQNLT